MAKQIKWLDRILYPFPENWLQLKGGSMHYVDVGEGDPVVFVHGTPTWSFVWRQQLKSLSRKYCCVAPDHLGFGLSDKPQDFAYTPEAHADNLETLITHLQLKDITLVVHDFGGPIGLRYALRHPANVKRLVVLNTWMWPLENETRMMQISRLMRSTVGRFLYQQLNFSVRLLLPTGYNERKHLTSDIHTHYKKPLNSPAARLGTWRFAVALHESNPYFAALWEQRAVLHNIPMLLVWGVKDKLLPLRWLEKWQHTYPHAKVVPLKAGHFLQDEKGGDVTKAIDNFMN